MAKSGRKWIFGKTSFERTCMPWDLINIFTDCDVADADASVAESERQDPW